MNPSMAAESFNTEIEADRAIELELPAGEEIEVIAENEFPLTGETAVPHLTDHEGKI